MQNVSSSCSLNYASASSSSGISQYYESTFLIHNISYTSEFIHVSEKDFLGLEGKYEKFQCGAI